MLKYLNTYILDLRFSLRSVGEGSAHLLVVPILGLSHVLCVLIEISVASLDVSRRRSVPSESGHPHVL